MNLGKELSPYIDKLRQWNITGNIDHTILPDLKRIYEDFYKVKPDIGVATVNLGCSGCVMDMLKALFNNYNEIPGANLVEFKGVPDHKPLQPLKETKKLEPIVKPTVDLNDIESVKAELRLKGVVFHQRLGLKKLIELLPK